MRTINGQHTRNFGAFFPENLLYYTATPFANVLVVTEMRKLEGLWTINCQKLFKKISAGRSYIPQMTSLLSCWNLPPYWAKTDFETVTDPDIKKFRCLNL